MPARFSLIDLADRWFNASRLRSGANRFARRTRLSIDILEDRLVPATITVTGNSDTVAVDGVVTLREAILSLNNGAPINKDVTNSGAIYGANDTIHFAPSLSGSVPLSAPLDITTNVTINGPGSATLALDGQNATAIMTIDSGVTATINGLTFANGVMNGMEGGAIDSEATLTLNNCVFQNNRTQNPSDDYYTGGGGAIYSGGTLTVTGCTFLNNTANNGGGAILAEPGTTLTITDSTFTGNSTIRSQGGAILAGVSAGDDFIAVNLTIVGSTFTGNSAPFNGGGAIWAYADTTISLSTFTGNSGGGGGALNLYSAGSATISDSTFAGNTSSAFGGAAIRSEAPTGSITGCTFANNTAQGMDGGAITFENVHSWTLTNDTLVGNAGGYGAAINFSGTSLAIESCTIANNGVGTGGGAIYALGLCTLHDSIIHGNNSPFTGGETSGCTSLGYNLIGNAAGIIPAATDLVGPGISSMETSTADGMLPFGTYYYVVVAINAQGLAVPSNESWITTGNGDTNRVAISWNAVPGATSYQVYGRAAGGERLIGTVDPLTTSFNDTGAIAPTGPLFPLLGPLAANGGPTQTIALPLGSLAVDRGDPNFVPPPATDQRGFPRVIGGRIDIGAYEAPPLNLDIDGNGKVDALTDGVLILRYLFGYTGAALTSGALGSGATRTDPAVITNLLNGARFTFLDADDNGTADALTDGLLILRYMFSFTGSTLMVGAVAPDAARTDPNAIQTYLDSSNPFVGHLWADGTGPGTASGSVAAPDLQVITAAAIARWEATDLSGVARSRLENARVQFADLGGTNLGETHGESVLIDRSAAGFGWFVDPTPFDNAEFQTSAGSTERVAGSGSPAAGRMDLLTVVMHELGLVMGLPEFDPALAPHSLMTDVLGTGVRRLA